MPRLTSSRALRWLLILAPLTLFMAIGAWWFLRCAEVTTLVLVRHADRDGSRDALTPAGIARSRDLLHAVEKLGLTAIFHSDTARTRDTAAPLAQALELAPSERPAADVAGLVREIFAQHPGERVLVVGHGNTVPRIIAAAGGPGLPDIPHDEFDDLFVLDVCPCRRAATLTRLQYGARSP